MRKSIFMLAAFLACGFIIAACSSEKKSTRSDRITVTVTPTVTDSSIGEITASSPTRTLTAIVRVNDVVQSSPTVSWVVDPSSFGDCVPNQGETTLFTADTTKTGTGTIIASYNGTSAYVGFSLNQPSVDHIDITASTNSVNNSGPVTLSAVAKDASGTPLPTQPSFTWSIDPQNLGTLSSTSGETVTFTAASSGNGTVTVTVSASGKSSTQTISVGTPVPVDESIWLYTTDYQLGDKVDVAAMANCLYDDHEWNTGVLTVMDMTPGANPWEIKYTMGSSLAADGNGDGNYGGFVMKFSQPQDLSNYRYISFDMMSETKPASDSTVHIVIGGNSPNYIVTSPNTPNSSWTQYKIDISAYTGTATSVSEAFNLVFTRRYSGGGAATGTLVGADPTMVVKIRNIRFEK